MSYALMVLVEATDEVTFQQSYIPTVDDLHEEIERALGYVPNDLLDIARDEWQAGTWAATDREGRDVLVDVEGAEIT